jgi:hypothetical protein
MSLRLLKSFRALNDPLRSGGSAERWIMSVPTSDAHAIRKRAVDVVGRFSVVHRSIGPAQVEALLKVDAWLEPTIAELTREYTANYEKSSEIELRLWQQAFDLVKALAGAYQAALRAGLPRADDRRWRAVLPWVLVRWRTTRGSTASSGCSATASGRRRSGGSSTSSTSSRGCAGGSASSWCSAPRRSRGRACASRRSTCRRCC